MKKIFFFLLPVLLLYAGQALAYKRPSQITGRLTGVPGNKFIISRIAGDFMERIDTITLHNGYFGFDVPFPSITLIIIQAWPTAEMAEKQRQQQILVLGIPNEQTIKEH